MAKMIDKAVKRALDLEIRKSKQLINEGRLIIESQFKVAHGKLMQDFESHAITRELKRGPASKNLSGTLPEGNLFGFIGFEIKENISQLESIVSPLHPFISLYEFDFHPNAINKLKEHMNSFHPVFPDDHSTYKTHF